MLVCQVSSSTKGPVTPQNSSEHCISSDALSPYQVADVCVEALVNPAAADKVVEIIAEQEAPAYTLSQLFENVYYTDY